jgi:hypothetical protein
MIRRRELDSRPRVNSTVRRNIDAMLKSLSLLLLFVVSSGAAPQTVPNVISKDEYSAYSRLINARFLRGRTNLAIIQARTEFDTNSVPIPMEFNNDLLTKTEPYTLERRLHIRVKYLLLTDTQPDALFRQDLRSAWDEYWRKYPNATGLLTFSRVAFNAANNKAFLYASEVCGPLCGNGYSFVLEKTNGVWKGQGRETNLDLIMFAPNKSLDASGSVFLN